MCVICEKEFKPLEDYAAHNARCKEGLEKKHAFCEPCQKQFKDKRHYLWHLRDVHLQGRPFSCTQCEKSYKTSKSLKEHMESHNPDRTLFKRKICSTLNIKLSWKTSYEREQQYLERMMLECLSDDENKEEEVDDEVDLDEIDQLEERSDSDTEQEIDESYSNSSEEVLGPEEERGSEPVYTGKDGTRWNGLPCSNKQKRTKRANIIKQLPGPKRVTKDLKTPLEIWNFFFNVEMLQIIVEYTNKHIELLSDGYTRQRDLRPTNINEIRALIGLLYISGTYKANHLNLEDLWMTNSKGIEIFRLTMSIKRFKFLLRCLRFDNKDTREERKRFDKLAAIRQFFDMFVKNCKDGYNLSEFTTIDEKLEAFRGNCQFRQYIPSKPNKYGVKIFALCDAKMFYTANLEVYVGRQPEGPFLVENSGQSIAERLSQPIHKSGRNITMDNWFMSIPLVDSLIRNYGLTVIGTLKKNKRELPPELLQVNRHEKSTIFAFKENCTLASYCPKKRKVVLLASSMHSDDSIDPESGDSFKPEILTEYNKTKGGVDVVDKLCATYNCARPTRRWPMVIFYACLNVGGINSQVIHYATTNDTMLRRKFLQNLGFALLEDHLRERAIIVSLPRNLRWRIMEICGIEETTLEAARQVNTYPEKGRCFYCDRKKNRSSRYFCKECHKFMCLEHATFICSTCLG